MLVFPEAVVWAEAVDVVPAPRLTTLPRARTAGLDVLTEASVRRLSSSSAL